MMDYVESGLFGALEQHSRRVAYHAVHMGKILGMTDRQLWELAFLAVLHDNGLIYAEVQEQMQDRFVLDKTMLEKIRIHCELGWQTLQDFSLIQESSDAVLYHHEYWDGSGYFGKAEEEIPLGASILCLANEVDLAFYRCGGDLLSFDADDFLKKNRGRLFSPEVTDLFREASSGRTYWYDLHSGMINESLKRVIPPCSADLADDQIMQIAHLLGRLSDVPSSYTEGHSRGVEDLGRVLVPDLSLPEEEQRDFLVSCSVHDLGKMAVDHRTLSRTGRLSPGEYTRIQMHPYLTYHALNHMPELERVTRWSGCHHERLDGSGYPRGVAGSDLELPPQALACLEIYHSLTEKRPYREEMTHRDAMAEMNRMAGRRQINGDIVSLMARVLA